MGVVGRTYKVTMWFLGVSAPPPASPSGSLPVSARLKPSSSASFCFLFLRA